MTANACPQNIWNHTDGCVCAPNGAITAEVTDVDLTPAPAAIVGEDFAARFRPEVEEIDRRWRDEADTDRVFNGLILALGQRVLDASEEDRPSRDKLWMAVESFKEDPTDDDMAEEVLFSLEDITRKSNMAVVEDGQGGHTRLADGRPGVTCENCGNGYATQRVLDVHVEQDCTGLDVTRDYSIDRDDYDHDDSTDQDGLDHDALHSVAESYASRVNNAGRGAQVAFLRAHGWTDENLAGEIQDHDEQDGGLDQQVIEAASHAASQAYNDGVTPDGVSQGLAEVSVTGYLDAKHFKSDDEFAAWFADPNAHTLEWGSDIKADDPLAWFINGDKS